MLRRNISRLAVIVIIMLMAMPLHAKKKVERGANGELIVMTDTVPEVITTAVDSMTEAMMTTPVLTRTDSATLVALEKPLKKKRDWNTWKPDPKRALWLALMIPGAGQIYNRKFWKLPIVYGGFIGCAYAMRWNNQMYLDYSQAYLDLMDDDPNTRSYDQFMHLGAKIDASNTEYYKDVFRRRKDKFRRWRDLSLFVMLGVYALSVVDAYVDAHLAQFDISDDLSLRLEPAVVGGSMKTVNSAATPATKTNILSTNGIGVRGALTF